MASPTFSKAGVTTLTFSDGESFPITRTDSKRQLRGIAMGGSVKILTLSSNQEQYIDLIFNQLTSTDITNIKAFLDDANINWSANTFTYTDSESNTFTVRFWNDALIYNRIFLNLYAVSIRLRVET
uniref:Uncharacterized protein n=1 Tax=viral metagenome TaxID=1070528 RepID=A0A6M3L8P2_9ZZZZ